MTEEQIGQRLQTSLTSNRCSSSLLRLIRQVQIFQYARIHAGHDLLSQGFGELSLFGDCLQDRILASGQLFCFGKQILNGSKLSFIKPLRDFFTIPRDERNRVAFFEQPHGSLNLSLRKTQFFCGNLTKIVN